MVMYPSPGVCVACGAVTRLFEGSETLGLAARSRPIVAVPVAIPAA
jgi:hypothetical protein